MNQRQQNAWMYYSGGLELVRAFLRDFSIISVPAGNTGAQTGGWFKREINTVADLQGLSMRFPGFGGQVMGRVGMNVQNIPGGELFLALDTGVIDGVSARKGVAVIAVVGEGMAGTPGIAARVFSALESGGINIVAIAQGSSERNISFVVAGDDAAEAARRVAEDAPPEADEP